MCVGVFIESVMLTAIQIVVMEAHQGPPRLTAIQIVVGDSTLCFRGHPALFTLVCKVQQSVGSQQSTFTIRLQKTLA